MSATAIVEVTVLEITPIGASRVLALASVELVVEGVAFALHGVQVVRLKHPETGQEATAVEVPRYRAPNGSWQPAATLPEELHGPLADAVLERCCELGITRRVA